MKVIAELNRFIKQYKFTDFKIVEGDLIFMYGEEGYGVEEFNHQLKMQKAWTNLQNKMVVAGHTYRSRK